MEQTISKAPSCKLTKETFRAVRKNCREKGASPAQETTHTDPREERGTVQALDQSWVAAA